jgi:hypothetical protein
MIPTTADMEQTDWWHPLGVAGQVAVRETVDPASLQQRTTADPAAELSLGRVELPHLPLDLVARGRTRSVRSEGETVAELDLSAPPDPAGGFSRPVTILGRTGEATRRTDEGRRSRLRGALRYLRITAGGEVGVWHYDGGRAAGERLVLCPGELSGSTPVVVTHPSAQGRSLGNPTGGATADTHVTAWTAAARPVDVLVVELLASTWLGGIVDYRPARVAEGVSELLGSAPRPDANTE